MYSAYWNKGSPQLCWDQRSPRLCFPGVKDLLDFTGIKDVLSLAGIKDLLSFIGTKDFLGFTGIKDLQGFAGIKDLQGFVGIMELLHFVKSVGEAKELVHFVNLRHMILLSSCCKIMPHNVRKLLCYVIYISSNLFDSLTSLSSFSFIKEMKQYYEFYFKEK